MLQTLRSKLPEGGLKLDPRMTLAGLALLAAVISLCEPSTSGSES